MFATDYDPSNRVAYFRVNFDHFWPEKHIYRLLEQLQKLASVQNEQDFFLR